MRLRDTFCGGRRLAINARSAILPLLILMQLGKEPDQMGFAWWDHVYNKAASNIIIDSDSDKEQIVCKTKKQRDRTEILTTRLPDADELAVLKKQKAKKTKVAAASSASDESAAEGKPAAAAATVAAPPRTQSPLYNLFVRAAPLVPLTPDQAKAAANGTDFAGSGGDSDSSEAHSDPEDEDALRDYSTQLDDATLLEICEGRQLGQRGGYKQTAKQERLARQEQELLKRLKAARAAAQAEAKAAKARHAAAASDVSGSDEAADQDKKKTKRRKKRVDDAIPVEEEPPAEEKAVAVAGEHARKKKRARDAENDDAASAAAVAKDNQPKKSKKKKRRTGADDE